MIATARAAGAIALLLCLSPVLAMLFDSFRGPDGFTLRAYSGVLREDRQWALLWRSLLVSAGATALALLWGTATGYAAWRLRGWKGVAVETLSYLPLLFPSLVIALGWVYLIGPAGVVTGWWKALFGLDRPPIDLYSAWGAAFVLSLCTFPCVTILAAQGFRSLDPGADRAARLSAGTSRRLLAVWWPHLRPHLAMGALLTFLLAFSDFGVASALMVNVYPIEVFTEYSAYADVQRAFASGSPAAVLALALVAVAQLANRRRPAERAPAKGAWGPPSRAMIALAAGSLLLSVGLPMAFLLIKAGGQYAEALRTAGDQMLTSLEVAGIGTGFLLAGSLAFAAAYRTLGPGGRTAAAGLALVPILVPGTVVGLGIHYLRGHGIWPFSSWYPDPSIVAFAGAARHLTFPSLILAAGLAGVRARLIDGARLHGASEGAVLSRIVLPLLWPSLAAAAAVSFIFCLGELSASVLVNPPGTMTLPVRLASLLHFGKDSIVASLCVMLCGVVGAVLALGFLAGGPIRLKLADRTA